MDSIWKPTRNTAAEALFLCAAGMLVAGLAGVATGGKLSFLRLALLGGALLLSAGFAFLARQTQTNSRLVDWWNDHIQQKTLTFLLGATALIFLSGWVLLWTPLENFGKFYYYALGAFPFLVWLTCASGGMLILFLAARFGINSRQWKETVRSQRAAFVVAGLALAILAALTWMASLRVMGMKPEEEDFWYGAGAPVLAFQVLVALIIGLGLSALLSKWVKWKWLDILLFVLIWAGSAFLWSHEPVRADFLVTEPVAPNFEMYPDYDARNYDLMSQYALIGQGINNHSFFDRVLYSAFLAYLHNLAGQDYARLMRLQAALFAVLPALLYLIGKRIHSRAAGLGLGVLLALRGVNHINVGDIIETAHQKQMLTEFPTAVLLVLTTYLLVKWTQNPSKNWPLAGLAGAIIALSTLLRPHPLVLFPVIIALAGLIYRQKARLWLGVSGLVVTAAFLAIIPWVQFGGQNTSIFDLYLVRIKVTIQQRYPQLIQPQGNLSVPVSTVSSGNIHLARIRPNPAPEKSITAFAADNFLNNLVTAIQVLPATPFYLDPRIVVKKTDNFWKPYWDGSLTPWARILIPLNLLFVALGIGTAWKRARVSGLIPLIVMLAYFAVNALARTSGGRYLVPVDWVVVVYYLLGLMTTAQLAMSFFGKVNEPADSQSEPSGKSRPFLVRALSVLLVSTALGALIPLAQAINPVRFPKATVAELADDFNARAGQNLGLSAQSLQEFLSTKDAIILRGRSLYPRQFNKDEGLDISIYDFYHSLPYPRTLFTTIGQQGEKVVILARTDPAPIANTADVMVLGCASDGYVQAWAVILLDDNSVLQRLPSGAPLACPLPDPVCDDNKNCR